MGLTRYVERPFRGVFPRHGIALDAHGRTASHAWAGGLSEDFPQLGREGPQPTLTFLVPEQATGVPARFYQVGLEPSTPQRQVDKKEGDDARRGQEGGGTKLQVSTSLKITPTERPTPSDLCHP